MNPVSTLVDRYRTDADRFGAVVEAARAADWTAQSPCEAWTAADVVDHVVDTQRDFLDQRGADLGPRPTGSVPEVWAAHQEAMRRVTGDAGFVAGEYDGYFGRTTIEDTLADFYGFDMLVHRWDVATALGQDLAWTEEELDRIEAALEHFGDNLYLDGVCKPAVAAPEDAPRQSHLLGRMGRRA